MTFMTRNGHAGLAWEKRALLGTHPHQPAGMRKVNRSG